MNQTEKLEMRRILPENPPEGLVRWAQENLRDELGREYITYKSEMVPVMPGLAEIMEYNDMRPRRKVRAAVCTCTNCGEEFITQWVTGGGFRVIQGEDGEIYTADPGYTYDGTDGIIVECGEGDRINCPYCGEEAAVIRESSLRGGRTKQIQVVAVQTVGSYAALIYWMVRKTFETYGTTIDAYPRDAYILTERGTLVRYSHTRYGMYEAETPRSMWELCSGCRDALENVYSDWGSINNRKKGGYLYPVIPDLTGTTGEKTGLARYCKTEDEHLYSYIKLWKQIPAVENLVNTGWSQIVVDLVAESARGYDAKARAGVGLNIGAKKPHEMLRMSKSDAREIRKREIGWTLEIQEIYVQALKYGLANDALNFCEYLQRYGLTGIRTVMNLRSLYRDITFDRVDRYMQKQGLSRTEVGLLRDARRMAKELSPDRELTGEELWPRNLMETHDRLTDIFVRRRAEEKRTGYQAGFDRVLAEYGEIQWTDGDLCVLLPKCENDLIQEGKILRHCVGGYGRMHAKGERLIFFIRHYRRPERSYYTLNIQMSGDRPKEIQLHGYGNEHHGVNKEHTHKIPAKVRAFCDRWEEEILLPWYEEKKKRAGKERRSA